MTGGVVQGKESWRRYDCPPLGLLGMRPPEAREQPHANRPKDRHHQDPRAELNTQTSAHLPCLPSRRNYLFMRSSTFNPAPVSDECGVAMIPAPMVTASVHDAATARPVFRL